MRWTHSIFALSTLWAGLGVFPAQLRSAPRDEVFAPVDDLKLKELLDKAETFEKSFKWDQAYLIYENILRSDRNLPIVRARYIHSIRRSWQVRRHLDASFRKEVLALDYGQAMRLFNAVSENLVDNSIDAKTVPFAAMLQKGIEELSFALADPAFCQQNVPNFNAVNVADFREMLQRNWGGAYPTSRSELGRNVREITLAAQGKLQLSAPAAITELAAGCCYAFDDYTAYLTPGQLRELYDSLKGDIVGIGATLFAEDGKIFIAEVAPMTPAWELTPPLQFHDEVVSINKKAVGMFSAEMAMEMLDGPVGTTVELEVVSRTMGMRSISLRRRIISSVSYSMRSELVGYMNISCFQETTLQDVDLALMNLNKSNMKALVLDLRGNTGGLFDVSVEVARRFLAQGVVVSTQTSRGTTILHARNPEALGVPLVVLVDSDTASSAEVLAGAIKENKRGRLVGQATFGKGCTQRIFHLPSASKGVATGGLRITVSRFFSPEGNPYSGRGVVPHMNVERFPMPSMNPIDHQIDEAVAEAQRLIGS